MNKKLLYGGLAGGVAYFFLGWGIYGILLSDFMAANSNGCMNLPMENMNMATMLLSNLLSSFMLALVLFWSNSNSYMDGMKKGALMGLLVSGSIDFSFYSMTTMFNSLAPLAVDVAASTVMTALVGALIGFINAKTDD